MADDYEMHPLYRNRISWFILVSGFSLSSAHISCFSRGLEISWVNIKVRLSQWRLFEQRFNGFLMFPRRRRIIDVHFTCVAWKKDGITWYDIVVGA